MAPSGRSASGGTLFTARRWVADHLVLGVGILVLVYTFVPIAYIIALSFNQPSGRSATAQFESFTWDTWTSICEPEGLCASLRLSVGISLSMTLGFLVLCVGVVWWIFRTGYRLKS